MFFSSIVSSFLLAAAVCNAWSPMQGRSSSPCNNSPLLCDRAYDKVTYLGAHDSPFVKDASTGFTASGNQFYNSTVQLAAGVRLLTAQVQENNGALHVCHTSCELLDAGPLSSWLAEVRSWMESNPHNVVTLLLVNGASASARKLGAQYRPAGITDSLVYTPSGTNAATEDWPTLGAMIRSGKRLVTFVDYIGDTSAAPFLMSEYDYMFENQYDVTSLDGFSCDATSPSSGVGNTERMVNNGVMPLMNHFLYQNDGFGIQQPNEANITVTNAPGDRVGNLGHSARQCKQQYGRAPSYIVVDFFAMKNVGPAIATVDRLNGVSNPSGRTSISTQVLTAAATSAGSGVSPAPWTMCFARLGLVLAFIFA